MGGIENDVRFFKTALPVIKEYLLSDALYWPLPELHGSDQNVIPTRLTPGNLLFCKLRLKLWPQAIGQDVLIHQLDELCDHWRSHWIIKVEKEIPARTMLWRNFLAESMHETMHITSYRYHIRLRVMLDLLAAELPSPPFNYDDLISALDYRLKGLTEPGPFLWEKELQSALPESDYWFLYRQPRIEKENEP